MRVFLSLVIILSSISSQAQTSLMKDQFDGFWQAQVCSVVPLISQKSPQDIKEFAKLETYPYKNKRLREAAKSSTFPLSPGSIPGGIGFPGIYPGTPGGFPGGIGGDPYSTGPSSSPLPNNGVPLTQRQSARLAKNSLVNQGAMYGFGGFVVPQLSTAVILNLVAGNTKEAKNLLKESHKSCYTSNPSNPKQKLQANPNCAFYELAVLDDNQFKQFSESITAKAKELMVKHSQTAQISNDLEDAYDKLDQLLTKRDDRFSIQRKDSSSQKKPNPSVVPTPTVTPAPSARNDSLDEEIEQITIKIEVLSEKLSKEGTSCAGGFTQFYGGTRGSYGFPIGKNGKPMRLKEIPSTKGSPVKVPSSGVY